MQDLNQFTYVNQKEYAISDQGMYTASIGGCVAIIVIDNHIHKNLLMHIDDSTQIELFPYIFDTNFSNYTNLHVTLVGGWSWNSESKKTVLFIKDFFKTKQIILDDLHLFYTTEYGSVKLTYYEGDLSKKAIIEKKFTSKYIPFVIVSDDKASVIQWTDVKLKLTDTGEFLYSPKDQPNYLIDTSTVHLSRSICTGKPTKNSLVPYSGDPLYKVTKDSPATTKIHYEMISSAADECEHLNAEYTHIKQQQISCDTFYYHDSVPLDSKLSCTKVYEWIAQYYDKCVETVFIGEITTFDLC